MPIGGEKSAVQNPFVRYAKEAGWTYLSPEEAQNLRRGLTARCWIRFSSTSFRRLNPGVVDHLRAEAIRDRSSGCGPTSKATSTPGSI